MVVMEVVHLYKLAKTQQMILRTKGFIYVYYT